MTAGCHCTTLVTEVTAGCHCNLKYCYWGDRSLPLHYSNLITCYWGDRWVPLHYCNLIICYWGHRWVPLHRNSNIYHRRRSNHSNMVQWRTCIGMKNHFFRFRHGSESTNLKFCYFCRKNILPYNRATLFHKFDAKDPLFYKVTQILLFGAIAGWWKPLAKISRIGTSCVHKLAHSALWDIWNQICTRCTISGGTCRAAVRLVSGVWVRSMWISRTLGYYWVHNKTIMLYGVLIF